jgi:hypothetical protein
MISWESVNWWWIQRPFCDYWNQNHNFVVFNEIIVTQAVIICQTMTGHENMIGEISLWTRRSKYWTRIWISAIVKRRKFARKEKSEESTFTIHDKVMKNGSPIKCLMPDLVESLFKFQQITQFKSERWNWQSNRPSQFISSWCHILGLLSWQLKSKSEINCALPLKNSSILFTVFNRLTIYLSWPSLTECRLWVLLHDLVISHDSSD